MGIISFGVLALNSAAPTAGIVGAVPASEIEALLTDQMACAAEDQPRC